VRGRRGAPRSLSSALTLLIPGGSVLRTGRATFFRSLLFREHTPSASLADCLRPTLHFGREDCILGAGLHGLPSVAPRPTVDPTLPPSEGNNAPDESDHAPGVASPSQIGGTSSHHRKGCSRGRWHHVEGRGEHEARALAMLAPSGGPRPSTGAVASTGVMRLAHSGSTSPHNGRQCFHPSWQHVGRRGQHGLHPEQRVPRLLRASATASATASAPASGSATAAASATASATGSASATRTRTLTPSLSPTLSLSPAPAPALPRAPTHALRSPSRYCGCACTRGGGRASSALIEYRTSARSTSFRWTLPIALFKSS
jgi:hypothetical protein